MREDILIAFKIYHLRMWRNQLYLQQYETRKGFHSCNKKNINIIFTHRMTLGMINHKVGNKIIKQC